MSSINENQQKLSPIVLYSIFIGAWTPSIPWASAKTIEMLKKSVPIAFDQVIQGQRSISSLLFPFGILVIFLIISIIPLWLFLRKLKKDLFALYKKEFKEFNNSPFKAFISLMKTTAMAVFFGGSAYLVSYFSGRLF